MHRSFLENDFKPARVEISDELAYFLMDFRNREMYLPLPEVWQLFEFFSILYDEQKTFPKVRRSRKRTLDSFLLSYQV